MTQFSRQAYFGNRAPNTISKGYACKGSYFGKIKEIFPYVFHHYVSVNEMK